jgi:hypothetical protein
VRLFTMTFSSPRMDHSFSCFFELHNSGNEYIYIVGFLGSHGSNYKEYSLLGCYAMYLCSANSLTLKVEVICSSRTLGCLNYMGLQLRRLYFLQY